MTHAPIRLPITANKKQFAKDIEIVDSRGFIVLRINQHVESFRDKKDQEIAAFIVKAVNAYDADQSLKRELVEALRIFDSRLTKEDESADDHLASQIKDLLSRAEKSLG